MRKHYGVLAVACGAVFAIAGVFLLTSKHEPAYQGRELSYWVRLWNQNPRNRAVRLQAQEAIVVLGTNNLDLLIRRISFEPRNNTLLRLVLSFPNGRARTVLLERFVGGPLVMKARLAQEASIAFHVMGTAGTPAIPGLVNIVNTGGKIAPFNALNSLEGIGETALPAMASIITNGASPGWSVQAVYRLRGHIESPIARAALTNALQNPDPRVRTEALNVLTAGAFE